MEEAEVGAALREALWVVLKIGGPMLVAALAVGLVVSLVQAVTQVNEATLVFLPKLLVLCGGLALMGPFIIGTMSDFTQSLMERVITVGGR